MHTKTADMESQDSTHSVMSWQQDLPDELPSWDFSEDVLGGFEHFLDTATLSEADLIPGEVAHQAAQAEEGSALPAGPSILQTEVADQGELEDPDSATGPSSSRLSSLDTKKQRQNRQAQARFRQRQRVRAASLEAQVAAATSQLEELQASQRQLEERNALLEAVARTNFSSDASEAPVAQADWGEISSISSAAPQTIVLTSLDDQPLIKTVQEVGQMPFTEFATLYAAYAGKIKQCLIDISHSRDTAANMQQLHRWTCEVSSMKVFLAVGNLKKYTSFLSSRLDGSMGPTVAQLPASWYHHYLEKLLLQAALQLSESQKVDMLHLRRLFYAKLGALRRERKDLLRQVPAGVAGATPDASTRLAEINFIAQQLHDNSAAEFRAFMQLSSAYRRGILTLTQQAVCVVKGFPYIADKVRSLGVLAAMQQEPPSTALTQQPGVDDFEHHTNWQQIVNYLRMVTKENLHLHVPLVRTY